MGCRRSDHGAAGVPTSSRDTVPIVPDPKLGHFSDLFQYVKAIQESGGPRIDVLPNYEAGPLNPEPILTNSYEVHDEYLAYLFCTYDVDEPHYDPSMEPAWFKASLLQIRNSGPESFYWIYQCRRGNFPFKWVAVVLVNRAEWHGADTFGQIHKVGAIFNIDEVFDSSRDLSELVAAARMDRHPFVFDPNFGESWEAGKHDRWMIVYRHAATTRPTGASK